MLTQKNRTIPPSFSGIEFIIAHQNLHGMIIVRIVYHFWQDVSKTKINNSLDLDLLCINLLQNGTQI